MLAALGAACNTKPRATAEAIAPVAPAAKDAAPIDIAPTAVAPIPLDAAPKWYTLVELMRMPVKRHTATIAAQTISIDLPEIYEIYLNDPVRFAAGDSFIPGFSLRPATGAPHADLERPTLTSTGELGSAHWSLAIREGKHTVITEVDLVNGTLSCHAYVETTERTKIGAWMIERCLTAK